MKKIIRAVIFVLFTVAAFSVSAKKGDRIRIGICTDVHLTTMHDAEYRITKFIDSMNVAKPDFIIELGDFITPEKKYSRLFEIWNSYPGEKYHVIGNHEMDGGTSLRTALEYRKMARSYYSFEKNGFHFIVLDGNDKKSAATKGYSQFIGAEQADWLKTDLTKTRFPVVIFSHQGLAHDQNGEDSYGIDNYREIQAILVAHNRQNPSSKVIACFNGHTHFDYAQNIEGIWYITITSMSYHWLGDKYSCVRYSDEVDRNFKWIKYTAPFKDPLYTIVEISAKGTIKIGGKKSEWVGPSPFELGYPEALKKFMRPEISKRNLKF